MFMVRLDANGYNKRKELNHSELLFYCAIFVDSGATIYDNRYGHRAQAI